MSANRRALLVSHVFPPLVAGGAPRMGQFARLLPEFGWDVTVVTGIPDPASSLDRAGAEEIAKTARIVEARSPASRVVKRGQPVAKHGWRGVARRVIRGAAVSVVFPDREVFWVRHAIKAAKQAMDETPHDVVMASYGPASNLLVGRALARKFRLPLVVEFRDLWSTLPMPVFPTRMHRAAAHRLERSIVRQASRVIAVGEGMVQEIANEHGVEPHRAITITNGFDPADLARVHDDRPKEPRPFRLMYAGTVHVHYNLEPLWRAMRTLADAGEITPETLRVEFVGNLDGRVVERHGLQAFVESGPYVAHDDLFDAFARADALLLFETPGYYGKYSYAAKVFDYMLSGKPVLSIIEPGGNSDRLLTAAGVCYGVTPGDEAGLAQRLRDIMKLKDQPLRRIDPDVSPFREFNRRYLVGKLASVLDDVTAAEPKGRW